MDTTSYVAITRQSGLLNEMQTIANNIANAATTGYRSEGLVFSEYVQQGGEGSSSVSMATARAHITSDVQGGLSKTGGDFDLAIEGDGFFMVETLNGPRLTRAGGFAPDAFGELVTALGNRVLDAGGTPIFVPPDAANVTIARDGTISSDTRLIGQVGVFTVADPNLLAREDGVLFSFDEEPLPADSPTVLQGFLEQANVNPVFEIARMIEVQRSYEAGQKLLDREDERIRNVVRTLGQLL